MNWRIGALAMVMMTALAWHSYGQPPPDISPTESTDPNHREPKRPYRKRTIRYLITTDPGKALQGNVCFENATQKMGFAYLLAPESGSFSYTPWQRFVNNLGVSLFLIVRAGPWWPIVTYFKRKKCIQSMGDYYGALPGDCPSDCDNSSGISR